MFRIELEQLNDMILKYESQLEMLDQQYLEMVKTSWRLRESWEGVSKEQFAVNSDDVCARLVFFTNRMKKMKNILKKTAQPEVNRELNRCEGFADTLCMYGPSEPGESHEPVGTLYLDDSYIAGIAEKSAGIGYEYTPREQSFWNNAMDCIDGGWFGRGGLKFVSLNMSGRDQEFRRYSKEQGDFILQFNESFFHYQQNIDSLEDRLSAEFGTIMEIQTADITGRIYEPLITADRSVNLDRLGYLMTLEPGALSDADYQDLIRAYELVSVDKQAKEVKDFINRVYLPHFKKMGGGKYQVSYTVSPVAKELSKRYRKYINGLGEVNLTTQAVRELRAEMLEAGCGELGEITGGIAEDNRPKGIFGETKRNIQEMWKNLDEKIIEILDGEVGSKIAKIHEKTIMAPFWYGLEAIKGVSSKEGVETIEQFQENWHELNHGMIVGEYQWVSAAITGVAGLPDTLETLVIALDERGGIAVIGDLVMGIINSVKGAGTEFIEGDAKTKGKVVGRILPDVIIAVAAAVKGVKAANAAKAAKTETGAVIKNSVETVEDLGEAGTVANLGDVVEGVVADKIDDVVESAVKGGSGVGEGGTYSGNLMSAEEAVRYSEHWRKLGIGSDNTWKAFKDANPNGTIDDYFEIVQKQSPWPLGETGTPTTLKSGDRFFMAVENNAPENMIGGFGVKERIESTDFVRNNLAVKYDWKTSCNVIREFEVNSDIELNVNAGPVGPQIDLGADLYLPGDTTIKQYDLFSNLGSGIKREDYVHIVDEYWVD